MNPAKRYAHFPPSARKERRASRWTLLAGSPFSLVLLTVVITRFIDYFSISSELGWNKVANAIVFLTVFSVVCALFIGFIVSFGARQKIRQLEELEFPGKLYLNRRAFGLFSDVNARLTNPIFDELRDGFTAVGLSSEGILLWARQSDLQPSLVFRLEDVISAEEGFAWSGGGRMRAVIIRVGGEWNVVLPLLPASISTFGVLRLSRRRMREFVDRVNASLS